LARRHRHHEVLHAGHAVRPPDHANWRGPRGMLQVACARAGSASCGGSWRRRREHSLYRSPCLCSHRHFDIDAVGWRISARRLGRSTFWPWNLRSLRIGARSLPAAPQCEGLFPQCEGLFLEHRVFDLRLEVLVHVVVVLPQLICIVVANRPPANCARAKASARLACNGLPQVAARVIGEAFGPIGRCTLVIGEQALILRLLVRRKPHSRIASTFGAAHSCRRRTQRKMKLEPNCCYCLAVGVLHLSTALRASVHSPGAALQHTSGSRRVTMRFKIVVASFSNYYISGGNAARAGELARCGTSAHRRAK